jgi:two-component system, LuxR family, response regulator FixJ
MQINGEPQSYGSGIHIVIAEHDPSTLKNLGALLVSNGYSLTVANDGDMLLDLLGRTAPNLFIVDTQLPGTSGAELISKLKSRFSDAPIIAICKQPTVTMAVDAMKRGASDFFRAPVDCKSFLERVQEIITAPPMLASPTIAEQTALCFPGEELLSDREKQVLMQIAHGASSKEAGRNLGVSPRTIDAHRANIMAKLQAKRSIDLVRLVLGANLADDKNRK